MERVGCRVEHTVKADGGAGLFLSTRWGVRQQCAGAARASRPAAQSPQHIQAGLWPRAPPS